MFWTVVVVWPAGSKVSGSMPTAIENVEFAPPLPSSDEGASGSLTLQAPAKAISAASAASSLIRQVRRRGAVVFMSSRFDEVAHNWTGSDRRHGFGEHRGGSCDHRQDLGEVAGAGVTVPEAVDQRRLLLRADLLRLGAAGAEVAARGRVGRAGDVAAEDDPLPGAPLVRVRDRHRGQQRLRVGV